MSYRACLRLYVRHWQQMGPESAQGLPYLEEQFVVSHFEEVHYITKRMQKTMYCTQAFMLQRGHRLR